MGLANLAFSEPMDIGDLLKQRLDLKYMFGTVKLFHILVCQSIFTFVEDSLSSLWTHVNVNSLTPTLKLWNNVSKHSLGIC